MNANNTFEYRYIIGEMQEFLIRRAEDLINLVVKDEIDTLVFLDRSARPAAWILQVFWEAKYPQDPLPPFIFINTGKKNLEIDEVIFGQIENELGSHAQENLPGKKVLIVDDIEKEGTQRKFVEQFLNDVYKPEIIEYFEWNKLGGIRLPHGLSYKDNGSFVALPHGQMLEKVEQVKREIEKLAKIKGI